MPLPKSNRIGEKKLIFLGNYANVSVKSAQKCVNSTYKTLFLWGGPQPPPQTLHPLGMGDTPPQTPPFPRRPWHLDFTPLTRPRRLRRLGTIPLPYFRKSLIRTCNLTRNCYRQCEPKASDGNYICYSTAVKSVK